MIGERLDRRKIAEASQSRAIVIVDEGLKKGISFVVAVELVLAAVAAGGRGMLDGLGDAAVEAFHHAVGLRPEGAGELVLNAAGGADAIEGMVSSGFALWFVFHIDGEAIGELRAIIGQDGMHGMAEGLEEAGEAAGDGFAVAPHDNLHVDEPRCPFDGHKDVRLGAAQAGQVLEIDVNEAEGMLIEAARLLRRPLRPAGDAMTGKAAMDGATGELCIHAAVHDLHNVIERQFELAPEFQDEFLLHRREADGQAFRRVRAVRDGRSAFPAPDGSLAHPELHREVRDGSGALLDVGPGAGGGRGVGVQSQFHDARRSFRKRMPRSTPNPSRQSSGTKHLRRVAENETGLEVALKKNWICRDLRCCSGSAATAATIAIILAIIGEPKPMKISQILTYVAALEL